MAQGDRRQDGLSFNYINMHLGLLPNTDQAFVLANTPIFTVYGK